ncbi:MAG TPA: class I adenylate-forming enzyme family protein [Stellaceae bacterium]|nr:class I adenylate-forming enzyme family protein [Stellaceae bacterium]
MNLAEAIARYAQVRPDAAALVDDERTIRYRDLDRCIRQGAARLRAVGIGAGDAVAICLGDNADHVIAFLSAARLGAISIPIDWRAPPAERARIATALGAKLALVETGAPKLGDVPSVAVDERWYAEAERQDATQAFPSEADAPLMIGLTSGTTGAVKGMLVTHRQMHARTIPFDAILPPGPHRYFSASPLAFSAGRGYCLTHLIRGHTVVLHPPLFAADEYVESVNRAQATVGFVVPTILRALLALPEATGPLLPSLRALICAGAPTHAEEKRAALRRLTPHFYEIYGTVGTGPITLLGPRDIPEHAESAGRPHEIWQIQIVDETDRALLEGAAGRLRVRGPGAAQRLEAGSAAAGEAVRDGWYYTGDIAALDAAGFLHLKGRASDMILRGGSNIYPDEVEAVLAEHAAVADVAVVGRPSPQLGEEVVAVVVARRDVAADELIAHCRRRLSAYKLPAEIVFVQELPRTSFGKPDRKRLASSMKERGAA